MLTTLFSTGADKEIILHKLIWHEFRNRLINLGKVHGYQIGVGLHGTQLSCAKITSYSTLFICQYTVIHNEQFVFKDVCYMYHTYAGCLDE